MGDLREPLAGAFCGRLLRGNFVGFFYRSVSPEVLRETFAGEIRGTFSSCLLRETCGRFWGRHLQGSFA